MSRGSENHFPEFYDKMARAGVSEASIRAFKHSYDTLAAGSTGMIPETSIEAVHDLPRLEQLPSPGGGASELLRQTLVIKLNGGLGTSMGLERAKSLLPVKDGLTFLDLIARQVLHLRERHGVPLRFMLMNSFSTSQDTLQFLRKYPALGKPRDLELMQSQAPKVDATTLQPVKWPENPLLEWCPPGHGDIYPSLLGSGWLDRLLDAGARFAFVSNADNLGACVDLALLSWFAGSGISFVMEVADRTASDRKGGHLACRDGRFLLRESAQCPEADMAAFQDVTRHRFFNTNNLWIRLDHLRDLTQAHGGFIPLPIIKNGKTVDPRNKASPGVIQLETAMGAAIECFARSGAVMVPRSRFVPVKTTSDLLALRSDAYQVTPDYRIALDGQRPPAIDLDPEHYRLVDQLDEATAAGVPSLKHCTALKLSGPVRFSAETIFKGKVTVTNSANSVRTLPGGTYTDQQVVL